MTSTVVRCSPFFIRGTQVVINQAKLLNEKEEREQKTSLNTKI